MPIHPDTVRTSVLVAGALLAAACASVDQEAARRDHVAEFMARSEETANAALAEADPLTLEDCVRIALENNLDVRSAEIESRLATLDRKIAFGALLPHLELSMSRTSTRRPPMMVFGSDFVQMSDQHVTELTFSAQQPIFLPQAWILYRMRREGEEIGALVERRVRQLVTLHVTARFYACLARDALRAPGERAREQARTLLAETRAQEDEGVVPASVRMGVETLLMAREQQVADNERALVVARAELLDAMGLTPLATIRLADAEPIEPPAEDLPALVLEALLARPELHVADRNVRIHEDAVLVAIAEMLPKIVGFGGITDTSDSFMKDSVMTAFGISGVVSLLDGFRNLNGMEAAEEREQAARLERERSCLAVVLEVLRAHHRARESGEHRALASRNLAGAEQELREIEARWDEGVATAAERLDALARRDRARADVTLAGIGEQVALATLRDVVGRTGVKP